MVRWVFVRRQRIFIQAQLVEIAALNEYVALNMSTRDDHLIQIDLVDKRNGMIYARYLTRHPGARNISVDLLRMASYVERQQQEEGV